VEDEVVAGDRDGDEEEQARQMNEERRVGTQTTMRRW
jgi:hypothetical protein